MSLKNISFYYIKITLKESDQSGLIEDEFTADNEWNAITNGLLWTKNRLSMYRKIFSKTFLHKIQIGIKTIYTINKHGYTNNFKSPPLFDWTFKEKNLLKYVKTFKKTNERRKITPWNW